MRSIVVARSRVPSDETTTQLPDVVYEHKHVSAMTARSGAPRFAALMAAIDTFIGSIARVARSSRTASGANSFRPPTPRLKSDCARVSSSPTGTVGTRSSPVTADWSFTTKH
jgi:hypothetical protein